MGEDLLQTGRPLDEEDWKQSRQGIGLDRIFRQVLLASCFCGLYDSYMDHIRIEKWVS